MIREYIRKEIKRLSEDGMKSYPIPPNIKHALTYSLKLNPLVRYVSTLKASATVPPSYRVFFNNNQHIDLIMQDLGIQALISNKKYWLDGMGDDGVGEAIKAMNRILTQPIPVSSEEETEEGGEVDDGEAEMEPETGGEEEEPEA